MVYKIEIDGWKAHIQFSAAHILPNCGKCARLHGHSYAISIQLQGQLTKNNLLIDFGVVKTSLQDIAAKLDHKFLISQHDTTTKIVDDHVEITLNNHAYRIPTDDCAILPIQATTAEQLAKYVFSEFGKKVDLPSAIKTVAIGISEGPGQTAWVTFNINNK